MEKEKSPKLTKSMLKKISATAAALIAAHGFSSAQVIINDITDDTLTIVTDETVSFSIDLNNDGVNDFRVDVAKFVTVSTTTTANGGIASSTLSYIYYDIKGLKNGNAWLVTQPNSRYVAPLDSSVNIKATDKFGTNSTLFGLYYSNGALKTQYGKFIPGEDNFIGVKFVDDAGNNYLGWIKVRITGNASLIIKKWAYEKTADSIVTGTKPYSIAISQTTSSGATIAVEPKFNGKIYYVVTPTSANMPTAENILNGLDGDGNNAIIASSITVSSAPAEINIELSGLEPETSYNLYLVSQDSEGNTDGDVFTAAFTTSALANINNAQTQTRIYPNPARNYVTINTAAQEPLKAEIMDINGKVVMEKEVTDGERIDVSSLKPGVYMVILHSENGGEIHKLIKY